MAKDDAYSNTAESITGPISKTISRSGLKGVYEQLDDTEKAAFRKAYNATYHPCREILEEIGTVNLQNLGAPCWRDRRNVRSRRGERTADFGPDLEGSLPGFSILNRRDALAAKMEQVVDRIVG